MQRIIRKQTLILLIFPLLFLLFQILIKLNFRYFFISDYDPTYAFLLNGLNLSVGKFGSGLAGFPGTTMQMYLAVVIRLGHIFNNTGSIPQDVLQRPEYYLNLASIGIGIINMLVFFITGLLIYKKVRRYDISMAFQLTPFISVFGFRYGIFIMCEPFLILAIQLIMLQLALYLFSDEKYLTSRNILCLALTAGFGLATKLTFIPIFFLPFFVIKGFHGKLKYLIITCITFSILFLPAYPNLEDFFAWQKLILLHTGLYGGGYNGILDKEVFIKNVHSLLTENHFLPFTLILLIIAVLVNGLIKKVRDRIPVKNRRILIGLLATYIIGIIILSKHYRAYYMGFFHGLSVLSIVLIISGIQYLGLTKLKNLKSNITNLLVSILGIIIIIDLFIQLKPNINRRAIFRESTSTINKLAGNKQRILIYNNMAASFKEGGIYYGLNYIKKNRNYFNFILKQLYPETYFFNIHTNRFSDWITERNLADIISKDTNTYIVRRLGTAEIPATLSKSIKFYSNKNIIKSSGLCYSNSPAGDFVFLIDNKPFTLQEFNSLLENSKTNCEHLTGDGQFFLSETGDEYFQKGYMRCNEKSYSGKFSVKLKPNLSYALDIKMNASSMDYFKATLKASPVNEKVLIVADDMKNGIYKASGNYSKIGNGWKTIMQNFEVGENYAGKEINFYVWYLGKDSCYVDDFEIKKFRRKICD